MTIYVKCDQGQLISDLCDRERRVAVAAHRLSRYLWLQQCKPFQGTTPKNVVTLFLVKAELQSFCFHRVAFLVFNHQIIEQACRVAIGSDTICGGLELVASNAARRKTNLLSKSEMYHPRLLFALFDSIEPLFFATQSSRWATQG